MPFATRPRFAPLPLMLFIAACADETAGPADDAPTVVSVLALADFEQPHTSLAITLSRPSPALVTYWRAEDSTALEIVALDTTATHHVFLPRLYQSSTYHYLVRALPRPGRPGQPVSGTFDTGELPAEVAALEFSAEGEPTDSLALIEVMLSTSGFGGGVIIVDEAGRIVWYWKGQGGLLMGGGRRRNGNWVFHDAGRLVEITPARELVRTLPNASPGTPYDIIHHDVTVTPQNTLYFIANEARTFPDSTLVGEAIWEWLPEQNQVLKRWSAFDFLAWPADRGPDSGLANWMHMNSLTVGARGNILYSSRALDQVVSIKPDFSGIEWRMGGVNATIPVAGEAQFSGQHNISEVAPDRILMWDNGRRRPFGQYSRGLELAVDAASGTVAKVGEFRGAPDRLQPLVGGAFRMHNGHTLITYGFGGGAQINIYELDTAGSTRWHLVAPPAVGRVYKARTLESIAGERRVARP